MADKKANKKGGAPKPPRVPVRALGAAAGALAVAGGIGWLGLNSFFTGKPCLARMHFIQQQVVYFRSRGWSPWHCLQPLERHQRQGLQRGAELQRSMAGDPVHFLCAHPSAAHQLTDWKQG